METVRETSADADWTKQSWDFPPYGSAEFNALVPDRAEFKRSPAYKAAVEVGLIKNDKWDPKMELTLRLQAVIAEQEENAE